MKVIILSMLVGLFGAHAGAKSDASGGGDFKNAIKLEESLFREARLQLAGILWNLSQQNQALVVPADLNAKTLWALVLSVSYQFFTPSKNQYHLFDKEG